MGSTEGSQVLGKFESILFREHSVMLTSHAILVERAAHEISPT